MEGNIKKVLYVYGGPEFHPTEAGGKVLAEILAKDGQYVLDMTSNLDALASLPDGQYVSVVIYTTGFADDLTPVREKGLLDFVMEGIR